MKAYDLIAQRAIDELRNQKIMPIRGIFILQFDDSKSYPNFMDIKLEQHESLPNFVDYLIMSYCLRTSSHVMTRKEVIVHDRKVIDNFERLQSISKMREKAMAQAALENTNFGQEQ